MAHIALESYIADAHSAVHFLTKDLLPWQMALQIVPVIRQLIPILGSEFTITGDIAVHHTATIAAGVVIDGPAIVSQDCSIAPHVYFRGGVFLGTNVHIGSACEVKASYLFHHSALAHLNYVGNSLIGAHVNLEAGAVVANHFNERAQKTISVVIDRHLVSTGTDKFGALIGDYTRIGANAVTTPGTLLPPHSIVGRLELVDQVEQYHKTGRH